MGHHPQEGVKTTQCPGPCEEEGRGTWECSAHTRSNCSQRLGVHVGDLEGGGAAPSPAMRELVSWLRVGYWDTRETRPGKEGSSALSGRTTGQERPRAVPEATQRERGTSAVNHAAPPAAPQGLGTGPAARPTLHLHYLIWLSLRPPPCRWGEGGPPARIGHPGAWAPDVSSHGTQG